MLKKQAIIGIVAAAIILVGAGTAYLYTRNNNSSNTQANSTSAPKEESKSEVGSIISLLKSGKSQTCTFSYKDPDNTSSYGTVYISGDKMKASMTIAKGDEESIINILRIGDESYLWGSSLPGNTGIKMTITADEFTTSSKDYFDVSKEGDYTCSDWTENPMTFEVPTDVNFSEVPDMIQDALKEAKITVPPTR